MITDRYTDTLSIVKTTIDKGRHGCDYQYRVPFRGRKLALGNQTVGGSQRL